MPRDGRLEYQAEACGVEIAAAVARVAVQERRAKKGAPAELTADAKQAEAAAAADEAAAAVGAAAAAVLSATAVAADAAGREVG